jgi:hypothetical protein
MIILVKTNLSALSEWASVHDNIFSPAVHSSTYILEFYTEDYGYKKAKYEFILRCLEQCLVNLPANQTPRTFPLSYISTSKTRRRAFRQASSRPLI